MPQPTFHLLVARQQLQRWERNGACPFELHDARNRAAFMHGAVGPDMGFFPGSARIISKLAHKAPTGDMLRALFDCARTARAHAFACGWATHLLLDALIHPVVNRTAAAMLGCSPRDHDRIGALHVRLEIGLDLAAHREDRTIQHFRISPLFDRHSIHFIHDAIALVHGVHLLPGMVAEAHRRPAMFLGPMMALQNAMIVARSSQPRWSPAVTGARLGVHTLQTFARSFLGPHSEGMAFLRPVSLEPELLDEVAMLRTRFHSIYEAHSATRFRDFPNYDVVNGGFTLPTSQLAAV